MGRGFSLSHQKVALEVAVSGPTIASGYTELTITPTVANLKTIHLNSRQTGEFVPLLLPQMKGACC